MLNRRFKLLFKGYSFKTICTPSFHHYIVLFKLCTHGSEEIVSIIFERIIYSLSTPSMNKNANYFSFSHNKDCLNFFIVFVKGAWTHSYSTWYSKVMAINIYTVSKNIDILNHITMRMPKDHQFVVAVYK